MNIGDVVTGCSKNMFLQYMGIILENNPTIVDRTYFTIASYLLLYEIIYIYNKLIIAMYFLFQLLYSRHILKILVYICNTSYW